MATKAFCVFEPRALRRRKPDRPTPEQMQRCLYLEHMTQPVDLAAWGVPLEVERPRPACAGLRHCPNLRPMITYPSFR